MWGNGKIFVSHTHADNERCAPLLLALDAWGTDYWFDTQQLDAGQQLTDRIQQALAGRDILLRICTSASRNSYWMMMELTAFRGLQAAERQAKGAKKATRRIINLILDPGYSAQAPAGPDPAEAADVVVDATAKPQAAWLEELRAAVGAETPIRQARGVSRRAVIGAGAVAVVGAGAAGTGIVLKERSATTTPPVPKPQTVKFAVPNPQDVDSRMLWYYKAGDDETPAIGMGQGVLYVNSGDGVAALKPDDGSAVWVNAESLGGSAPVFAGGMLYAEGGLGKIFALSPSDGSKIWSATVGSGFASGGIVAASGLVLAYDDESHALTALAAADGSVKWKSPDLGKAGLSSPSPVVSGDAALIGTGTGAFYAISLADGSIKWQIQAGSDAPTTAAVANGLVCFGASDSVVYGVDLATGAPRWRYPTDLQPNNPPAISGDTVYFALVDYLYALDAASGTLRWKLPVGDVDASGFGKSGDGAGGTPTVAGNAVYVCGDTYLYAFDLTKAAHYDVISGQPAYAWRFRTATQSSFGSSVSAIIVSGGTIYFGAPNRAVFALKAGL